LEDISNVRRVIQMLSQLGMGSDGYMAFAVKHRATNTFKNFFVETDGLGSMVAQIMQSSQEGNWWFCPHLFSKKERKKEFAQPTRVLWADLDELPTNELRVEPTLLMRTSKNRTQALWFLDTVIPARDAEDLSRRIAYAHAGQGADTSGWDLTQLLRVPFTLNFKYNPPYKVYPERFEGHLIYPPETFGIYPEVDSYSISDEVPELPGQPSSPPEALLSAYSLSTHQRVRLLFSEVPKGDWSKSLWELQLALFEGGMTRDEVFWVCQEASCNKFRRDGRPDSYLWTDVLRAESAHNERYSAAAAAPLRKDTSESPLLSPDERQAAEDYPSFVHDYVEWAKTLGDAAWQYHQAGAFVILSTLLAGHVVLPTSFGTMTPNLWFMILADTTLTRKSTAMDVATDLARDVDPDCILATDGSVEGLLQTLSGRPRQPSLFLRDEFTGMIEAMARRDYLSGMAEALTKLYDGKYQKRVLKREVIEIDDPVLNFFAGGIRTRLFDLLTYEHVTSGFLPRFIFITAESDVTKLKPIGPPTDVAIGGRKELFQLLVAMREKYLPVVEGSDTGRLRLPQPTRIELTREAWVRYNQIEAQMLQYALDSDIPSELITPLMDRLAKSGLKMAALLAAADQYDQEGPVIADEFTLIRAFYYIEQWRPYTIRLAENVGSSPTERQIKRIMDLVRKEGSLTRAIMMRRLQLQARDADQLVATLEQRGLVRVTAKGKRGQVLSLPEGIRINV
jgi:hypothetical protein